MTVRKSFISWDCITNVPLSSTLAVFLVHLGQGRHFAQLAAQVSMLSLELAGAAQKHAAAAAEHAAREEALATAKAVTPAQGNNISRMKSAS